MVTTKDTKKQTGNNPFSQTLQIRRPWGANEYPNENPWNKFMGGSKSKFKWRNFWISGSSR
jgi:hypothetical protein